MAGESRRHGPMGRLVAWLRPDADVEAEGLTSAAASAGATPVARCPLHDEVQLAGVVKSVMLRPVGRSPALAAELYDGSGSVDLIWLGRRQIRGIETGRYLVARGRLTSRPDGRRVLYNPRYELRAGAPVT